MNQNFKDFFDDCTMEFKIGEIVKAEMSIQYPKFKESDKFEVVDREIIPDGDHLYTLKGIDGEYYEAYGSSIYK